MAPLNWSEAGERTIFGPDMVQEAEEQVRLIQANLKIAQSRQKSYANKRSSPLTFEVGDHVYLKISPWRGVQRFGIKGKLAPRYIGPYPIVERCGPVTYRLDLPAKFSAIHNIFHVSQLKKCLRVPSEAIDSDSIQLESDLTYPEQPIKIIDRKDRVTHRTTNQFYKVQRSNHSKDEATWEKEEFLKSKYPEFLNAHPGTTSSNFSRLFKILSCLNIPCW